MPSLSDFESFCRAATGYSPFRYQARLAEDGLPDLLRVPTGAGKTLAAVLPWLFRRRAHPDPAVRAITPRRLVVVLPQRTLVEQTHRCVSGWLSNVEQADPSGGWGEVGQHLLMGGACSDDREWKQAPASDAVFVGTQDMVLSRLLMRGYGEPRTGWPMSFGLLHADTQFVFDEVQLMGPGLPTSLQLEGLRRAIGTAVPCRSMWMSATIQPTEFERVPDLAGFWETARVVELEDGDAVGDLGKRLAATRMASRLEVPAKSYARDLAAVVAREHRPGTRSIVVVNTVDRAVSLYEQVVRAGSRARVVLLHSRFRPPERAERMVAATDPVPPEGTIVVATQVLEAGVDISSALLVSELAPWSSMVQRAGRCNRAGDDPGARLLWVRPQGRGAELPYTALQLDLAEQTLRDLEQRAVTSSQLQAVQVDEPAPLHPVLRRRDLLDLFDTLPDLSGNDVDVSRWIRDADERTVSVAWWPLGGGSPDDSADRPAREELCQVPLAGLRELLREHGAAGRRACARAWVRDHPAGGERARGRADSPWTSVPVTDLTPGALVVLDVAAGGYDLQTGWHGRPIGLVSPVSLPTAPEVSRSGGSLAGQGSSLAGQGSSLAGQGSSLAGQGGPRGDTDESGADPLTGSGRAVTLAEHLDDVEDEVRQLLAWCGTTLGLTEQQRQAVALAGALHDLGKAHPVFADSITVAGAPASGGPWAKSGSSTRLRHARKAFRHELVSMLMLLSPSCQLLDDVAEPDLVAYLVAAHHGKVRMGARSAPGELASFVLGVSAEDVVPGLQLPDGRLLPDLTLPREIIEIGQSSSAANDTGAPIQSWTARACSLRDRPDLGIFRLAFMEALVRSADWRVSARYDQGAPAETAAMSEQEAKR